MLPAVLLCVLALGYWESRVIAPVVLPQETSRWNGDLYTIYYPAYSFAYRSAHFLPAWNPHQLAGMPFIAGYNGGFLYPPNFLAAVLPVQLAIGYGTAFHIALAGVFVFLAGRALGLIPPAAVLAGVGFMLNGYFTVELFRPSYLAGLAWVPAVLLSAGRLLVQPNVRAGVLLGVALAFQFLTGHAQIVCYEVYALPLGAVAYLLCRREWQPGYLGRIVGAVLVGAATAGLLTGVQVAPTLELVARATRGPGGLTLAQTMPWTPSLKLLREVVLGGGSVALLAVLAFIDARRLALLLPAVLLAAFSALVGLGTAVYRQLFYLLPGVSFFRLPHQMLAVGNVALAILAGVALDKAVVPRPGWTPLRQVIGGALGLALVAALGMTGASRLWATAAVLAVAAIPFLRSPRWRVAAAWIVVVLLAADRLGGRNTVMLPQHNPPSFFAPPPFVDFLRQRAGPDRVLVIKNWDRRFPIMEKAGTLYGLNVVQDYEPLAPAAYHEFLHPLEDANVDAPLFWGRFYPRSIHPAWKLLDMLATRYVVVAPGADWPVQRGSEFELVYTAPDARIFENHGSLPRAYLVTDYQVVPDPGQALAAVQRATFDPRTTAIVDREVAWRSGAGDAAVPETVGFSELAEERLVLQVSASRRALLVLSDLYWPGWRVAVDGEERPAHRVNYLFRGVPVEPGTHTVRWWYDPWRFTTGGAVSAATGAVLLLSAARSRRHT